MCAGGEAAELGYLDSCAHFLIGELPVSYTHLIEMDEDARWTILHDTLVYLSEQAYFAPCYYPTMSYAHTAGLVFNGYDPFVGLQLRFLSWE